MGEGEGGRGECSMQLAESKRVLVKERDAMKGTRDMKGYRRQRCLVRHAWRGLPRLRRRCRHVPVSSRVALDFYISTFRPPIKIKKTAGHMVA